RAPRRTRASAAIASEAARSIEPSFRRRLQAAYHRSHSQVFHAGVARPCTGGCVWRTCVTARSPATSSTMGAPPPDGVAMSRTCLRAAVLIAASLATSLTLGLAAAQQPQPPSFTANTRTVAVYATVTDARHRLV